MNKKNNNSNQIASNRKARHDFHIIETIEAGVMLTGWEIKSIRAGRAQLRDSHVIMRSGEVWLLNMHISPLITASTHVIAEPTRTRKLLLHKKQISKFMGKGQEKGFSIVPLSMYWKSNKVKLEIALVKGKKLYDKREAEKTRDWNQQKARILKSMK
ncbi:MAG: SsrA-binding protein SmpB [Alcanivoracaceae bacterium]|nr:SsrA-binding protein SmpB [Alcanivoracaceae bacterium]